jgi:hypothetical protein
MHNLLITALHIIQAAQLLVLAPIMFWIIAEVDRAL